MNRWTTLSTRPYPSSSSIWSTTPPPPQNPRPSLSRNRGTGTPYPRTQLPQIITLRSHAASHNPSFPRLAVDHRHINPEFGQRHPHWKGILPSKLPHLICTNPNSESLSLQGHRIRTRPVGAIRPLFGCFRRFQRLYEDIE